MQAVPDVSRTSINKQNTASVCNTCLDRFACMCYHQPDDCPLDDPYGRQESIHRQAVEEFTESKFFRGVGYGIAIYLVVVGVTFAVVQAWNYWPQIMEWITK